MRSEPRMSTWPETFAVPKLANSCGSDVKSKEHRMIHRKFRLVARFATCAAAIVTAGIPGRVVPTDGDQIPAGTLTIHGYGITGDGHSIERVDVSLDDGHTWQQADLHPAPSRWSWRPWSLTIAVAPAPLNITARAWADTGITQPESAAALWNPRGYGNNAYAHIELNIV